MKTHIASAFDKNFLVRGLATYRSIYPHTPDAHFWVLCLDNETKPMMEKNEFEKCFLHHSRRNE